MERTFTEPFTIGRGIQATLHVDSGRVSRIHAEVVFEGGRWLVRDAGSTNGTYYNGERIDSIPLEGDAVVRLGKEGPTVYLSVDAAGLPSGAELTTAEGSAPFLPSLRDEEDDTTPERSRGDFRDRRTGVGGEAPPPVQAAAPAGDDSGHSVSQVIRRYFNAEDDGTEGDRTRMIRQAYQQVQAEQKRTYGGIIGVVALLLVVALGFAIWQQIRVERLEATAQGLFYEMKERDLATAQLRMLAEETGNADLQAQLEDLDERRRRQAELYEGYIEELGVYRSLSEEEREIYRVARIFNESEFTIPAGFVREVQEVISQWQNSSRFENALQRAEDNGYTPIIVRTLQKYGLPPEFFYLAMQESNFNECAVGPETRWGIAKGMWQFIPPTGQAYGLSIGPRSEIRVCDELDDRHDFAKSTDAAARYLLHIYTELAQASGLLVMASYNWGEHRVSSKLDRLPDTPLDFVRQDLADIPANPQQRNYWRFLTEYRERMPDETKGYVLHIFSAAVIGHNPRLFGFDFDNPLAPYLEEGSSGS